MIRAPAPIPSLLEPSLTIHRSLLRKACCKVVIEPTSFVVMCVVRHGGRGFKGINVGDVSSVLSIWHCFGDCEIVVHGVVDGWRESMMFVVRIILVVERIFVETGPVAIYVS